MVSAMYQFVGKHTFANIGGHTDHVVPPCRGLVLCKPTLVNVWHGCELLHHVFDKRLVNNGQGLTCLGADCSVTCRNYSQTTGKPTEVH